MFNIFFDFLPKILPSSIVDTPVNIAATTRLVPQNLEIEISETPDFINLSPWLAAERI